MVRQEVVELSGEINVTCLFSYELCLPVEKYLCSNLLQQNDSAWNPPHSRRDRVQQHEVSHH